MTVLGWRSILTLPTLAGAFLTLLLRASLPRSQSLTSERLLSEDRVLKGQAPVSSIDGVQRRADCPHPHTHHTQTPWSLMLG